MIEVLIRHLGSDTELGRITIEKVSDGITDHADYSIRFSVDRHMGVGIHQRGIHSFPRTEFNVFALLLQALNTLEPDELKLDGQIDPGSIRRKMLGWGRNQD